MPSGGTISSQSFPPGTSRYTLAMARCLEGVPWRSSAMPERPVVHALINLVQGRMLEYLADRICREFQIEDQQARIRMVTVLMGLFSDEFFALFRFKIDQEPGLVVEIARRILRKECRTGSGDNGRAFMSAPDRLYPAIFRKYFDYRHLDHLLELIESDAAIQRIILSNLLLRSLDNRETVGEVLTLTDADPEGITSNLFMGYIQNSNVQDLLDKIQSGDWKKDLSELREKMAHLRGE